MHTGEVANRPEGEEGNESRPARVPGLDARGEIVTADTLL
jgi:hypothetical protein